MENKTCIEKNGEKYFDIINDYLNSISAKSEIVIKNDPCNKLIKIYDNYYNDDATKNSFFGKYETYHSIEWQNHVPFDESSSKYNACIEFATHYYTKEGVGKAEKSTLCVMSYDCAKALFTHAERIACLKSIIKK